MKLRLVNRSKAFALIEIMVVMVVIASMATITGSMLFRRKPETEWKNVMSEFNNFVHFARQESIATQKVYRLLFQANKTEPDFIIIQKEETDPENPEKKLYNQVESDYFDARYNLPDAIKMEAFYLSNIEQFADNKGKAYCYVVPNGLVQDVMIYLIRNIDEKESKATFKMAPFFGNFEFYEGFFRPEK